MSILEEIYEKFEVFCRNNGVILIDNSNIRETPFVHGRLHLVKSGKRILANHYIAYSTYLNFFWTNSAPRGVYLDNVIFDDETSNLGNLDKPCDTTSIVSNLKPKNVNRLVIGHLNINFLPGKFD